MKPIADYSLNGNLTDIQLAPVTRLDLIQYAGASGDFNPIHTIDEEAEKAGLPGVIAHGMWTMGNLSKLFTPYYEEGFIEEYSIRFRDIVRLDDVLTLKATFLKKVQNKLYFEVIAVNQEEKIVVKGRVVFTLYT
ncbi:dehydratase [Bacillus sp. FJAT-27231]|uniref:MaoC/PaaZ C-terminal domain-containing protein n=1 Tax=Bacillus sp. FJAT-27231 TaxID=1679168 RepID=UPI000670C43D|nr:MaoC/PaaZ C-terminal domain-containing protein [Bacillus sp. FJAT-27231]KMY53391.1 dehydratase [Bacillus sp. FJAT-27231]